MTDEIITLDQLLNSLAIPPESWDLLVLGDGSGQGWNTPCGWAAVSIDRLNGLREFMVGGASCGTVNVAELEPCLHALRRDLYHHNDGKLKAVRRVAVVSDSEVTVRTGNGEYRASFNPDLWASLEYFRSAGYQVTFYWTPRNQNPMHSALDAASKQGDFLAVGLDWLSDNLYDILPWDKSANAVAVHAERLG
jgi:ribonuclease HI